MEYSNAAAYFLSSRYDDITLTAPRRGQFETRAENFRARFNSDLVAVGGGRLRVQNSVCGFSFHIGKSAFVKESCIVY